MTFGQDGVQICPKSLDLLMPMNIVFDGDYRIVHAGPTLSALTGPLAGRLLMDVLRIRRPKLDVADILSRAGRRLLVEVELATEKADEYGGAKERLRAVTIPLQEGGGLVTLAFGSDLPRAAKQFNLTATDFSPVDAVLETLYLLEAQALIRTELRAMTERLDGALRTAEQEATTDRLTGLGNRRAMDRTLADLMERAGDASFGVMHMDLDHFKAVNDTLGHAAGDRVLAEVGRILREETRRDDQVCRMGGDEFVLIFPNCSEAELLSGIAERILRRLAVPIPFEGKDCQVSGSIGITLSNSYASPNIDSLLSDADAALYRSKRAGRSRYSFHGDPTAPRERGSFKGIEVVPDRRVN